MSKDDQDAIARQRLKVILLAERLGNVSEACRRSRISRTRFYEWKRRYEADGLAGLRDRNMIREHNPRAISEETARRILRLSMQHPAWGCNRLAAALCDKGTVVSAVTVQKLLNRHALGRRQDRRRELTERKHRFGCRLGNEQLDFVHPRSGRRLRARSQNGLFRFTGDFAQGIRVFRESLEKTFGVHPLVYLFSSILSKHALSLLSVAAGHKGSGKSKKFGHSSGGCVHAGFLSGVLVPEGDR